jgi:uncharacterized membrane protein YuzA (DUF378 family)
MEKIKLAAMILVIIGALNWGLVAIDPKYDAVKMLLAKKDEAEPNNMVRAVYAAVGIAAVYFAYCKYQEYQKK